MKKIKRGAIQPIKFLFLAILSIALVTTIASSANLSPEEQTDVSIPVDNDSPIIEIHSPQNTTYNNFSQILINFTITDLTLNTIWYSLNHEQNITISSPFYLNFSENNYILTLYANDSLNRISSEEVSFLVSNSIIPCGDAICSSQESCSSCQQDCGSCPQPPGDGGSSGGGGGGGGAVTQQSSQDEDIEIPEQERNQTPLGGETASEDEAQTNGKKSSQTPSIFSTTIFIIITLIIISSVIILIIFYKKRKNKKTSKSKKRDLSKKNKSSNIQPVQPAFYH